jgi:hypothetical protein
MVTKGIGLFVQYTKKKLCIDCQKVVKTQSYLQSDDRLYHNYSYLTFLSFLLY